MPQKTISNNLNKNILSEFLLKPYIKGNVERPNYYFINISPEKEHELDLLLLTQGWSRYNWHDIFNNLPKKKYDFEQGLILEGSITSKFSKDDKILLYNHTTKKKSSRLININDSKFELFDTFILKDEAIGFSLLKKNGKLVKPKLSINISDNNKIDKVKIFSNYIFNKIGLDETSLLNMKNLILKDDAIKLDEVIVTQKVEKEKIYAPIIYKRKVKKVTQQIIDTYPKF